MVHTSFTLWLFKSAIKSSSCLKTITAISSYCQLSSSVSSLWAGKPDDQACWTHGTWLNGIGGLCHDQKQVLGFGAQVADLMGFLQQLLGLASRSWGGTPTVEPPHWGRKVWLSHILPSVETIYCGCAFPLLPGLPLCSGCLQLVINRQSLWLNTTTKCMPQSNATVCSIYLQFKNISKEIKSKHLEVYSKTDATILSYF